MFFWIKEWAATAVILLLLPYMVVLFSGMTREGEEILPYEGTYYIMVQQENCMEKMDLETYVCGAASAVLPADASKELIKAQLILVRTNVVREIQKEMAENPDLPIEADCLSERYQGKTSKQLLTASHETAGQILVYEDVPIEAAYHAVSNGKTRDSIEVLGKELPYLSSVECTVDIYSRGYYLRKEFSREELGALIAKEFDGRNLPKVCILERDHAGYVKRIQVNERIMTGDQFRELLGLNSSDFTIIEQEDRWIVVTKGIGHGLGMSQYCAEKMGQQGESYKDILEYFFPGTELKKIE